jgi:PAS domain S-box-containing protein
MTVKPPKNQSAESERLSAEVVELRLRLDEAEQTLQAICTGGAESLVVEGPNGPRVFSLEGADHSYRILVEAMNEGAATLGEDGTILYCNSRFAEMLEFPLERVMGSAILGFLPDRSREAFEALVREASGGESRGELELLSQGGHIVPVYLSVSVIRDSASHRLCLVAADIRARKRNEEMVASERLARSVLEQAADAVVVCDETGRIIRASRSATDLCGCNPLLVLFDMAFPMKLDLTRAPDSDGRVASYALRGDVLRTVPAWLERGDGSKVHLLVSAVPLTGSADQIIGCVVSMTDITELERAEEALRQADRRKNEFMAMLSHELRNPLAPIRNSIYVLERAVPGGDQARRALAVIDRQSEQLAHLVDDLLDVTRITQNKIRLQLQVLDLNELVRQTAEDQRSLFHKAEVQLDLCPASGPVFVNADSNRLAQVIGNLLQNAAKFTGRGGATRVTIRVDEADQRAVVEVADTGTGMAPELVSRLFQPFSQADSALDRGKGGLGLGLALVKGLVELHGGEVTAQSDFLGKGGSEFIVRLPMATEKAAAPQSGESATRSHRRVLIIEDNIDAADSLREVLEFGAHEVEVAYNGPEGVAKAREFCPDVVLCDIGLPGMDGYEVAQVFRADKALRSAHLVALSGYAQPEDLRRSSEAGFEQHLAKPPSIEKLEALLANASHRSINTPTAGGSPLSA